MTKSTLDFSHEAIYRRTELAAIISPVIRDGWAFSCITHFLDANEMLAAALKRIAGLNASGPHTSKKDGMEAALASLDRARDLARTALAQYQGEKT